MVRCDFSSYVAVPLRLTISSLPTQMRDACGTSPGDYTAFGSTLTMAYIPKDAEWFLAKLVEEFRVQGRKRNVVHLNYVLIRAKTPTEAYRKAIELGERSNRKWKNPWGEEVTHRFLGLRQLDVIHDPLEHGCEIMFIEKIGMSKPGLRKLIRKRKELEAFLPIRGRKGRPDYSSKEIMDAVAKEITKRRKA
jgi:hypothetical protein